MRAAQFYGREAAFGGRKPGGADLAEDLPFGAVVFIKEGFWGITARACAVIRDVTFRAPDDREDSFVIALLVVRDEFFVSPVLAKVGDQREFVDPEFLVLWGMGNIKSPLFKRDVSADKIDQPAVLLVKKLNQRE